LENASLVFDSKRQEAKDDSKDKILYSKIGELQIEIDFLKKSWGNEYDQKRELIFPTYTKLSIVKQCKSLGLQKSSYYCKPKGGLAFKFWSQVQ
jgi:hypothetical protein